MDIDHSLRDLGLSSSEVRIYRYLLEHGLSTPSQIAKSTGILRTNSYHILRSLMEQGLVLEQSIGKRKAYATNDPGALMIVLERKKEIASHLLPDLRGLWNVQKNKPTIRYYDGLTQVQEIYRLALDAKEITALGSTERLYALLPEFTKRWLQDMKQRNIVLHDTVTHPSSRVALQTMSGSLKGLYDAKILPAEIGELSTDILLWNDHIALITLEEPYFGTIITSAPLIKTFKSIIKLLRERL